MSDVLLVRIHENANSEYRGQVGTVIQTERRQSRGWSAVPRDFLVRFEDGKELRYAESELECLAPQASLRCRSGEATQTNKGMRTSDS